MPRKIQEYIQKQLAKEKKQALDIRRNKFITNSKKLVMKEVRKQ